MTPRRPYSPPTITDWDTTNMFAVGVCGPDIVTLGHRFNKRQALNLAAYLVAVSGTDMDEFSLLFKAIAGA